MDLNRPFLAIPDLQIPYEHPKALRFCLEIKKEFRVPEDNILCVGDEVDELHGSCYPKDPDVMLSPRTELSIARERIRQWSDAFPKLKIATSNHGIRWVKKAAKAEIPSELMRSYRDIYGMPKTWVHQDSWTIRTKYPFLMKHGMDCSGKTPYRGSAEISPISTIFGHLHSSAGICYVNTPEKRVWSFNVGCLIDVSADAFKYERHSKFKPVLGVGIVCNRGLTPLFFPLE